MNSFLKEDLCDQLGPFQESVNKFFLIRNYIFIISAMH